MLGDVVRDDGDEKKLRRIGSVYERTGQQGDGHHQEEIRRRWKPLQKDTLIT